MEDQIGHEGLGLGLVLVIVKSFGSNLFTPMITPQTESHNEPNAKNSDFPLVRVRVNNPDSCFMGARVSEPPKPSLHVSQTLFVP